MSRPRLAVLGIVGALCATLLCTGAATPAGTESPSTRVLAAHTIVVAAPRTVGLH
ncbi:hypothetical protein [Streptomyces sp. TE33382]